MTLHDPRLLAMLRLIGVGPAGASTFRTGVVRSIATECGENGVACEAPTDFVGRHGRCCFFALPPPGNGRLENMCQEEIYN